MRCYELQEFSWDGLRVAERPEPNPPGPGEAAVRVHAVSLNYRDYLLLQGSYNPKQKLPLIPCSDGAGEVIAVGAGVTRVKPGDRVYGTFFQSWISGPVSRERTAAPLGSPLDGMLTEIRVLNAEGLAHIPAHLTYDEAATLPCAAVTAWNALVVAGQVKAGDTVLVQGTGGVSIFALQFAKLHGARVIVTSSSDEKLAAAKSMGADGAVNYKSTPDWDKAARQWSDGLGVDHVIEVGGAGTFGKSLRAARQGGHIAAIGVLSGGSSEMNLFPLLMQSLRVSGIFVGSRDMAEAMNRAIAGAGMRPAIDRVFEFGQAVDALRHLADGAHFGKIVIRV